MTYSIEIDVAYDDDETAALADLATAYRVTTVVVDRVNGWPVVRVSSNGRGDIETLLRDRDETWRSNEIEVTR